MNQFIRNLGSTLGLFAVITLSSAAILADENPGKKADDNDALKRVDYDVRYLASDELEGRGVQTKGIKLAADYIVQEYKKAGLKSGTEDGSFRQEFPVMIRESRDVSDSSLVLNGPDGKMELKAGKNFSAQTIGGSGEISGELVFLGYGIKADEHNYDDYADMDLEGKIVVIIRNEPQANSEDSVFDGKETSRYASVRSKVRAARRAKAAGILMVNDHSRVAGMDDEKLESTNFFGNSSTGVPFAQIERKVLDKILAKSPLHNGEGKKFSSIAAIEEAIDDTLEPISQAFKGWSADLTVKVKTKSVKTDNIIGVVEGEGPHADETIVIGGHYDHLGFGGYGSRASGSRDVHNGADDNATGTAAVIELARRFGKSEKKPGRRLVFVCFSGEERGLVGSRYYVENPTHALDKTVAMINYDMIGWLRKGELTVYGSGTAKQFDDMLDVSNKDFDLTLKKQASPFAGSDHMPFSQKKIPVMFLHSGLTDTYHTPEDDYESLNIPGAVKVIDYSEKLLWEMANYKGEFEHVDFARGGNRARRNRTPTPRTGLGLRYSEEGGTTVRRISEGSAAEAAGLKEGDVITEFGGKAIKSRQEFITFLRSKKPGDKVKVKYSRDGKEATVELTLGDSN